MRLIGKPKGVCHYPQMIKSVTPTQHKYGKSITWSQCTDTYKPTLTGHGIDAELQAFKHNLQLTILLSKITDDLYRNEIIAALESGRLDAGLYFLAWAWENPTTKTLETNPLWNGTTFLQSHADIGLIDQSLVGTEKALNYYTIGGLMYTLSSGRFGYDEVNGVMGATDVVTGSIQKQVDWFKSIVGKYPSYTSYSYGRRILDNYILNETLVTRSSSIKEVNYNFDSRLEKKIASSFNYDARDYTTATALVRANTAIQDTIAVGGWYTDFSHWHWAEIYGDKDQLAQYFEAQRSLLNTTDAVTLGMGEAVEYMFLRKLFKRGGIYQDGSEMVLMLDVRNDIQLPFKTIDATLSIPVDLTGTTLEGQDIAANTEIIKLAVNQFIVQVPYTLRDGFAAIRLKSTATPSYMDFALPVLQTNTITGNTISITTDRPTKIVVFGVPIGSPMQDAQVITRSADTLTVHDVVVQDGIDTMDIYVGAITKEKQSALFKVK